MRSLHNAPLADIKHTLQLHSTFFLTFLVFRVLPQQAELCHQVFTRQLQPSFSTELCLIPLSLPHQALRIHLLPLFPLFCQVWGNRATSFLSLQILSHDLHQLPAFLLKTAQSGETMQTAGASLLQFKSQCLQLPPCDTFKISATQTPSL